MATSRTIYQHHKKIQFILRTSIVTAAVSFIVGSVIFWLYIIEKDKPYTIVNEEIVSTADDLLYVGAAYVVVAFLINILVLASLIICSFVYRKYQRTILKQATILLINIPVAILYIYLLTIL